MRICILADGESIHTIRWCRHFHELGHELHLISFKNVTIPDIAVHYVDSGNIKVSGGNWKVIFRYKEVKALLKKIKPDVLHSLYATSYGIVGALTGFHPYIVTPLGSDVLLSPKESIIYRSLLKYTFRKADCVTCLAPHMRGVMERELDVPKEKIRDIVFGINTGIFNKNIHQLPANEFVISSIRNFEKVYNHEQFIRAIKEVKGKIPALKVVMAGDGSMKQEMIALAGELGLSETIEFRGKLPQHDIAALLGASHVCVTVSLSDGNALSLLEAMACGAYPVVSDIPANREWIEEGINGNLVKTGDVEGLAKILMETYRNYAQISGKAMQVSGRLISEKGSWQANMLKMEKVYQQLAENGK
jgi:glycosyltransferase involved in cell wall biosynthesis